MDQIKYEHLFVMGLILLPLASCFSLEELKGIVKDISASYSGKNDPEYLKTPPITNQTETQDNQSNADNQKTDQQWSAITNSQAEKGCLKQAQKVAIDGGYPKSFIFNCKCTSAESTTTKTYNCKVSTADILDPIKPVNIYCIKAQNTCAVTSQKGTQIYNFDELEKFANQ